MAGIKSINEMKAPLDSEMHVPKIATQAIAEPPRPTTTEYTPEEIVDMCLFQEKLFVATRNGVYMRGPDGIFYRQKFKLVEEQNE